MPIELTSVRSQLDEIPTDSRIRYLHPVIATDAVFDSAKTSSVKHTGRS
jgi:hypothetical protein